MRTSSIVWIVIILIVLGGAGWYYYTITHYVPPTPITGDIIDPNAQPGPSGAAGINGSPNQGNLGGTDTGAVQQPGTDYVGGPTPVGTVVGGNVVLGVGKSDRLGAYLIGYTGMTVYTFAKDKTASSTCYGQCAQIWPPYVIGPADFARNVKLGVNADKVGTITRADGTIQVTYDGHPLYFYAQDASPEDTKGENFNKLWFVVKP